MDENKKPKRLADDLPRITVRSLGLIEYIPAALVNDVVILQGPRGYIRFVITLSLKDVNNQHLILEHALIGNDRRQGYECEIPLVSTPCRYGGFRLWFKCPLSVNGKVCGRRVAVLYLGGYFYGCRHCYDLTYRTRNTSGAIKKAGKFELDSAMDCFEPGNIRFYNGRMTKRYRRLLLQHKKFLEWDAFTNVMPNKKFHKHLMESKRLLKGTKEEKSITEAYTDHINFLNFRKEVLSGVKKFIQLDDELKKTRKEELDRAQKEVATIDG